MIATTNLTGSLDSAFERRFLYKIEFEKPTPNESRHIWKSMLPELTDEDALSLASSYAFLFTYRTHLIKKVQSPH